MGLQNYQHKLKFTNHHLKCKGKIPLDGETPFRSRVTIRGIGNESYTISAKKNLLIHQTTKQVPVSIDLFHNGGQIKYSFVLMLMSLNGLATMGTVQKNISTTVRPVGLIDINTKGS